MILLRHGMLASLIPVPAFRLEQRAVLPFTRHFAFCILHGVPLWTWAAGFLYWGAEPVGAPPHELEAACRYDQRDGAGDEARACDGDDDSEPRSHHDGQSYPDQRTTHRHDTIPIIRKAFV